MIWTLLSVLEVVYLVVLGGWILLEKRSPVATLAWLLLLGALPIVGFVIFFMFGPRRLQRKRVRRLRSRAKSRAHEDARSVAPTLSPLSIEHEQLVAVANVRGDAPLTTCHDLDILTNPVELYRRIEETIDAAKDHVHVLYYILEDGKAAEQLRGALLRARRRGVDVRVLVDAVGSSGLSRGYFRELEHAGGFFAVFNPAAFTSVVKSFNFRNHRKVIVVDGAIGFTGGINMCDAYLPNPDPEAKPPWRDTHLTLAGAAVRYLQLAFMDDWAYATGDSLRGARFFPRLEKVLAEADVAEKVETLRVQVIEDGPDTDDDPIHDTLFAAITSARQRVWLTTPYFIPDEALAAAITTTARRGVDVRILIPKQGDSKIVTYAARSYYDAMLAAGVKLYEYTPTMLHAKTSVIDDAVAVVGTANLDNRSLRLSFEIVVMIYGTKHNKELAQIFEEDLAYARLVTPEDRAKLSAPRRTGEAAARLLSPLL